MQCQVLNIKDLTNDCGCALQIIQLKLVGVLYHHRLRLYHLHHHLHAGKKKSKCSTHYRIEFMISRMLKRDVCGDSEFISEERSLPKENF